jgi:hypothetical protein
MMGVETATEVGVRVGEGVFVRVGVRVEVLVEVRVGETVAVRVGASSGVLVGLEVGAGVVERTKVMSSASMLRSELEKLDWWTSTARTFRPVTSSAGSIWAW